MLSMTPIAIAVISIALAAGVAGALSAVTTGPAPEERKTIQGRQAVWALERVRAGVVLPWWGTAASASNRGGGRLVVLVDKRSKAAGRRSVFGVRGQRLVVDWQTTWLHAVQSFMPLRFLTSNRFGLPCLASELVWITTSGAVLILQLHLHY